MTGREAAQIFEAGGWAIRGKHPPGEIETVSLRRFSDSAAIVCLFGTRRLSQQISFSFAEPRRGIHPYIRTPRQPYSPEYVGVALQHHLRAKTCQPLLGAYIRDKPWCKGPVVHGCGIPALASILLVRASGSPTTLV
jgi:hypothetical protein